jgi:hypothetical protein
LLEFYNIQGVFTINLMEFVGEKDVEGRVEGAEQSVERRVDAGREV